MKRDWRGRVINVQRHQKAHPLQPQNYERIQNLKYQGSDSDYYTGGCEDLRGGVGGKDTLDKSDSSRSWL